MTFLAKICHNNYEGKNLQIKKGEENMKGHIKFFDRRKGFGFVTGEDGKDYFTSYAFLADKDVRKHILKKDTAELSSIEVSFDVTANEKGPIASNVSLV